MCLVKEKKEEYINSKLNIINVRRESILYLLFTIFMLGNKNLYEKDSNQDAILYK